MARTFLELAAEAVGYLPEAEDTDADLMLVISINLK